MSEAIAKSLKRGIDEVLLPAVRDAGKTVKKALHSVADGAEQVAHNAETAESHAMQEFTRAARGDAGREVRAPGSSLLGTAHSREHLRDNLGPTPVYRIRDDGVVERLTRDGPKALDAADRSRLAPLNLNGDEVLKAPPRKYNLPKLKKGEVRPGTHSTHVPFGDDELGKATQLARHEDGSYGSYAKKEGTGPTAEHPDRPAEYEFSSNNYAAARYGHEGADDGFILVGRSRNPNPHSERVLGIPMLESGSAHGFTSLYTERAPCTNAPNCSGWMHHYLPSHIRVTHSADYGDAASRATGNRDMEHYLNALRPRPHGQYRP